MVGVEEIQDIDNSFDEQNLKFTVENKIMKEQKKVKRKIVF